MSKVFAFRYLWTAEDKPDSICMKMVTDTEKGLEEFETALKALPGIKKIAKEYLHEYDCSRVGVIDCVLGEVDKNEKS